MPRKKKDGDSLEVRLTIPREFDIKFTRDLFAEGNEVLAEMLGAGEGATPRVMIVADRAVVEGSPDLGRKIGKYFKDHGIALAAKPYVANGGEINKTNGMTTVRQITEIAADAALCRDGFMLVIGGGAMLDAAGFAAATFNRGLRTIRIPSTLLAQCGGGCFPTVGTNILNRKDANSIWQFPHGVAIDFDLLNSLPANVRGEGAAEAVKIAAARDAKFLEWIGDNAEKIASGDRETLEETVRRSAALHAGLLAGAKGAPEPDAERIFEFGHWSAHRIEALGRFRIPHGAALAAGLCIDAAYAASTKLVPEDESDIVGETLSRCGSLGCIDRIAMVLDRADDILWGLEEFRQHTGAHPLFPAPLGKAKDVGPADVEKMREILLEFGKTCRESAKDAAAGA